MSFTLFISSDNIDDGLNQITPLVVVRDGGPVLMSQDEGNSWSQEVSRGNLNWTTAITSPNGRIALGAAGATQPLHIYDGSGWKNPAETLVAGGWASLASSLDMSRIAAVSAAGRVYLSSDAGLTWTMHPELENVVDVAMSDDGKRMACVERGYGGYIRISQNYGETWTSRNTSTGWETVTMTGDGRIIVAAENSGYVFVSDNGGDVFVQRPLSGHWREVTIAKGGWKIVAVMSGSGSGGPILVSKDYGLTWEEKAESKQWMSVMMTPDATKMVALASNEYPYVSLDGGETWSQRLAAGKGDWRCVALSAVSRRQTFEQRDAPPTTMTASVRLPTLSSSRDMIDQRYTIYLERYFLDCVWRDSERPDLRLTANSGTSKSDKIYVTFYAGDMAHNVRLIDQSERTPTGLDCDVILHRNSDNIGEMASFYEYTDPEAFDSRYWFENQYTNQSQTFAASGFLIGPLNIQALLALRRVPYITVKMETNRTDKFKSPFWYRKFLTGVSLFDEKTGKYDIVENGTTSYKYYKKVGAITLTAVGQGPYQPKSLYTFAQPLHPELFDGDLTSVFNVKPSANGCINLMNSADVEIVLQQVALPPQATNASVLEPYTIPGSTRLANGEFAPHPIYAKSDMESYEVSTADGSGGWTTLNPELSGASSGEFLGVPNGSWRGEALRAKSTAVASQNSAFPWEQALTADQLRILDGSLSYNGSLHGTQVLPTEHYLYMPSGDWGERVGERSLQIDFGKQQYVNKLQMIFPKSQERWQPTRLNATLQRAWPSTTPEAFVDQYPSLWHQGFQYRYPYGQNDGKMCKYIHTLSQRWQFNGSEGEMLLGTHTGNLTCTYTGNLTYTGNSVTVPVSAYNLPVIVGGPVYANVSTREVEIANTKTFETSPNAVNPAFDFKRFEYGPFYQGATRSWLTRLETLPVQTGGVSSGDLQKAFPIAVCPRYRQPSWNQSEKPNNFFFGNFHDWLDSEASEKALGGLLQKWFPTGYSYRFAIPFWGAPTGMFEVSSSSGNAGAAFDFDDSTYWAAGGYSGTTYDANSPTYIGYIGNVTTPYSGTSWGSSGVAKGEWLQIKAPRPISVDGLLMQPRQPASTVWKVVSATHSNATGPLAIVVDSSNRRFTMTTRSAYDKANGGIYAGTGPPLPNQREFVYNPNQTPNYSAGSSMSYTGEYFIVQFDRPKRIKGYTLAAPNLREAPREVVVFCKNSGDPYWYKRSSKTIEDWTRRPEDVDDDVANNPDGFTHWAVVVPRVQVSYIVQDPAHVFAIYDTFLGKEIRAKVEQRAYKTLDEVALVVASALNSETKGQITYTVTWNPSQNRFEISNSSRQLLLGTGWTGGVSSSTPYPFSILATDLATVLGFEASPSPSTSFLGSSNPPIIPQTQNRVKFSITFHEAGDEDDTGYGALMDSDQPVSMRLLGSNDGQTWKNMGRFGAKSWRSRGSLLNLDLTFDTATVPGVRIKRTPSKYQYFRFVFLASQRSTNVSVSKLALYAYDYDSPEYAAAIATQNLPVFPLDYGSLNERDGIYKDCYDWLLQKFTLYQIYNEQPLLDYMVKEEYHFAPNLDQQDEESTYEPFGSYRPNYKAVAQKMLQPRLAEGRYAGLAVGYESTNRGHYVGNVNIVGASPDPARGRDHKCFSWRLCHQLYDFYSKGGEVSDKNNKDAVKARFNKRFEMGMLTGIGLVNGGMGYVNEKLGDTDVSLGQDTEMLVDNETVVDYAKAHAVVGANVSVNNVQYTASVSADAASNYEVTMVDLSGKANVIPESTKTASEKSPLYRKADFVLNFKSATS